MLSFAVTAGLMTLVAAGAVLLGLRADRRTHLSRTQMNIMVLRQQMGELEVERSCGRLDEPSYWQAREELERRLLADAQAGAVAPSPRTGRRQVMLAAAALPAAALAIYLAAGSPQLLGAARSFDAAAEPAELAQLQAHLAASPADARAWILLARAQMQADQFEAAAVAFERATLLSPKVARDPQVWCEWADALALDQGALAGRPLQLIEKALALDPAHPRALEMAGSAAVEAGDYRAAQRHWSQLLAQLSPESAERQQLQLALEKVAQLGRFALPPS